jgi:hypothetical protein
VEINYLALGLNGAGAVFLEGSSTGDSFTPKAAPVGQWSMLGMHILTESNMASSLNGVITSELTAVVSEALMDTLTVGALMFRGEIISYFQGEIAEVACWDAELTNEELKELAEKRNPTKIRPEHLIEYWQLKGFENPYQNYLSEGLDLEVGLATALGESNPEIEPPGEEPEPEIIEGSATLVGSGDVSARGVAQQQGQATLMGAGAVEATGRVQVRGAATISGTASVSCVGKAQQRAEIVIVGSGVVIAKGKRRSYGEATLIGQGIVSAQGEGPNTDSTYKGRQGLSTYKFVEGGTYPGLGGESTYGN